MAKHCAPSYAYVLFGRLQEYSTVQRMYCCRLGSRLHVYGWRHSFVTDLIEIVDRRDHAKYCAPSYA